MPTFQEILEGITRHRANPVHGDSPGDIARKFIEIEWALQAIAEKGVELEAAPSEPPAEAAADHEPMKTRKPTRRKR